MKVPQGQHTPNPFLQTIKLKNSKQKQPWRVKEQTTRLFQMLTLHTLKSAILSLGWPIHLAPALGSKSCYWGNNPKRSGKAAQQKVKNGNALSPIQPPLLYLRFLCREHYKEGRARWPRRMRSLKTGVAKGPKQVYTVRGRDKFQSQSTLTPHGSSSILHNVHATLHYDHCKARGDVSSLTFPHSATVGDG